jgi:signal transduction histidine kinase
LKLTLFRVTAKAQARDGFADPSLGVGAMQPLGSAEVVPGAMENERERLAAIGEMAAEIAHELRNVLLTISSSAHVGRLAVARGDAQAAEPHLVRIERHASVANHIVDDIMGLARGEPLSTQPTPLLEVVAAARAESSLGAARWDDGGIPADLRVEAHPRLLARLLHVVYDNAIRASAPRAPTVTTRAWARDGRVFIEIADDGPGVPETIAGRVFEPLVSAREGGSGLGLALARRIAVAHGGTLELAASGGDGATFRVELPRLA